MLREHSRIFIPAEVRVNILKDILMIFCLITLILCLSGPAGAGAPRSWIESIVMVPDKPDHEDSIVIEVKGQVPSACYTISRTSSVTSSVISITVTATPKSNCIPFGGPVNWKVNTLVNPLNDGVYTIRADLRNPNGDQLDSLASSVVVLDRSRVSAVQILNIRSSLLDNLQAGQALDILVDAVGPANATLQYQFFSKAGYGTPEFETNPWIVVQDWSTKNSASILFPQAGNYFVVSHVKAAEDPSWDDGEPQGGIHVVVVEEED